MAPGSNPNGPSVINKPPGAVGGSGTGMSVLGMSNQFGIGGGITSTSQYGMNGSVSVRAPPGIGSGQMDNVNQRFGLMPSSSAGSNNISNSGVVGGMGGLGGVSVGIGGMPQQGRNTNLNMRQSSNPIGMNSNPNNMSNGVMGGLSMNNLMISSNSSNDVTGMDSSGTGKTAPFDLSDFPALGNRGGGPGGDSQGPGGAAASGYALHVSQRMNQQQHDFAVQKEDFPALPGFGNSNSSNSNQTSAGKQNLMRATMGQYHDPNQTMGVGLGSNLNDPKNSMSNFAHQQQQDRQDQQQANSQNSSSVSKGIGLNIDGLNMGDVGSSSAGNTENIGTISSGALTQSQAQTAKTPASQNQYGLLGLLGVIRMEDADRGTLALGTDLTTLGLNLNSSDSLHTTFASPWADGPSTRDPPFQIPACYLQNNNKSKAANGAPATGLAVKPSHFSKFQLESLFYIFYSIPRDIMQVLAAQELYNREWRYHMDLKLWFAEAEQVNSSAGPGQTQYIYFDINAWERRLFSGNIPGGIESSFMRKEAIFSLSQSNPNQAGPGSQLAS
mmetsp:Transcript_1929/g.2566  ORF Transcript_1929/g.2566 Transcript_1929/m.2566 type:complete len:555 (+) Transcript_1929:1-1665(+)|eukprot:CAMPEP_0204843634 /NCGR_PEP_ID=MMETSP1346-20131115/48093_1 /ASSEMBLY_ACC=CAM_ASM_000771 /TAXON_ID=215587 /ORGANISM="Aplanochytrium stocchinoi, Strain GSBS06" /LENGTH=554 /DNA_ID=CAMNT_0051982807 /DNA_START=303 /DNA_END=1967 /DNA_ORIENTATION=+